MRLVFLIALLTTLVGCQTLQGHYQENKGHIKFVCDDIMDDVSRDSEAYKSCLAKIEIAQAILDTKGWVKAGVITTWTLIGLSVLSVATER